MYAHYSTDMMLLKEHGRAVSNTHLMANVRMERELITQPLIA